MLEDNKALVRKFFEILGQDKRLPAELLGSGIIYHVPGIPPLDLKAMHRRIASFNTAFPDVKHSDMELIAEGDKVASRSQMDGTHTGEFMGVTGSNKHFTVVEMLIFRISKGKIVEMWGLMDMIGLMRQLGVK